MDDSNTGYSSTYVTSGARTCKRPLYCGRLYQFRSRGWNLLVLAFEQCCIVKDLLRSQLRFNLVVREERKYLHSPKDFPKRSGQGRSYTAIQIAVSAKRCTSKRQLPSGPVNLILRSRQQMKIEAAGHKRNIAQSPQRGREGYCGSIYSVTLCRPEGLEKVEWIAGD